MTSIIVGYVDTPEGHAALNRAVDEAQLRSAMLVVIHSMKGAGHESDEESVAAEEAMEEVENRLANPASTSR